MSFFMDLIDIPAEETPREDISLKEIRSAKKEVVRHYEVEKKELSKNIQAFDKKRKVYVQDPYAYNTISLKKVQKLTPTASQMIANPLYNTVGKMLGLDTAKEWNQYYDKVYEITEWALKKTKDEKLVYKFIADKARTVPSMGARRIDDIFIHAKISK